MNAKKITIWILSGIALLLVSITLITPNKISIESELAVERKKIAQLEIITEENHDYLKIDGSVSMVKLLNHIKDLVENKKSLKFKYGGFKLPGQQCGSLCAIRLLAEEKIDIAVISIDINKLKRNEINKISPEFEKKLNQNQLISIKIAKDNVVVVVKNTNPVYNITIGQLRDIYSCFTHNWSSIENGYDRPIKVINRSKESGTRTFFQGIVLEGRLFCQGKDLKKDKNGEILFITSDSDKDTKNLNDMGDNGIYYLSEANAHQTNYKKLSINGFFPKKNKYPLKRSFYLLINQKTSQAVKDFVHFILSESGQAVVEQYGEKLSSENQDR